MPQSRGTAKKVRDSRRQRAPPRPSIDHPKGICSKRASLPLVIVREKFGLVCRNVAVRRAFRFARFAREAQIERFLDVLVFPAAAQHFALQQLTQKVRAPARAVFFFSRGHVTRAHCAAIIFSTCSEPNAS